MYERFYSKIKKENKTKNNNKTKRTLRNYILQTKRKNKSTKILFIYRDNDIYI